MQTFKVTYTAIKKGERIVRAVDANEAMDIVTEQESFLTGVEVDYTEAELIREYKGESS